MADPDWPGEGAAGDLIIGDLLADRREAAGDGRSSELPSFDPPLSDAEARSPEEQAAFAAERARRRRSRRGGRRSRPEGSGDPSD